jgi:hypothetical protein
MWRRYVASVVGFVVGALLAWLIGFENKLVAIAGLLVAAVVMTFGERWGLVPPAEEVGKPQTLFSNERDKTLPRDTSSYVDSLEFTDELKNGVWERIGSLTYDKGRNQRNDGANVTANSSPESRCAKCRQPMKFDDVQCSRCGTRRDEVATSTPFSHAPQNGEIMTKT